jgi:hypothetical protein
VCHENLLDDDEEMVRRHNSERKCMTTNNLTLS